MRVLFFGLGGIGQRHLRIIKKLYPDFQIAAVRKKSRNFEIGDDLIPNYNIDIIKEYNIKSFSTFKEALKFNPDFALISNPTSMHVETAIEVLNNNIPVFIEKPISDKILGLDKLLNISNDKNIPVIIGYMMRFNPCAKKLKDLLDNNILGRIYSITLNINSFMPNWHKYEKYNEFYAGLRSLGGGVILTEIHEIDLLYWHFGNPERLWAVGGKYSKYDIDVEDNVNVLIEQRYKDYKFPINISMSFVQPEPYRKMVIFGENGKIEWDIAESELIIIDKVNQVKDKYNPVNFQRNDMFIEQMKHFVECIKEKKEAINSLNNVIGGHLVALTIKKSLKDSSIQKIVSIFKKD